MKNEKLESMLNKVVEFNKPDVVYCKGFLYKDYRGYYLKVVEGISGWLSYNDKHWLSDGDEEFIIIAEKPKLMRVSLKSWHYQLVKFVLRSNAPTPKTMQNGCPYFWLLLFSILALPFVALSRGFVYLLLLVPNFLVWGLEKLTESWVSGIDENEMYGYYWKEYKMPMTAKLYFEQTDEDFIDFYLQRKLKKTGIAHKEYSRIKEELREKWFQKSEEIEKRRAEERKIREEREIIQEKKRYEYLRKQEIRKAKWDARMKPIEDGINNFFKSVKEIFTFKGDWKNIIRRTKQVIGGLITLILLGTTYFMVNILALVLMGFIDFSIEHWYIYAVIGILAVAAGIIYILYIVLTGWVQGIISKYERGRRVWYIEPLIYLIYYPIKYIVIVLAYGLMYIFWIPIKYTFYVFLWKVIIQPFGLLIWRGIKAFGNGFVNSLGVFGEYFNASYTDYCPGIEWCDTDEENV